MRLAMLVLGGAALALAGCGSDSAEEAKVSEQLAPKPPTAEQQAQMEKIKAQFPQGSGTAPGRP